MKAVWSHPAASDLGRGGRVEGTADDEAEVARPDTADEAGVGSGNERVEYGGGAAPSIGSGPPKAARSASSSTGVATRRSATVALYVAATAAARWNS